MSVVADGLVHALAEAVRPFVRRLLAHGVPFGRVESRLRELFVELAERELALPGRPSTDSRIALLTGIYRKEVKRIRARERVPRKAGVSRLELLTSLVSRWLADPRTTDAAGRPLPLPYRAEEGPSFMALAREVTGDLAPRVLLDELLRTGAARMLDDDRVALATDSFVPQQGDPEKLQILAEDPAELVETMLRNVLSEVDEPLLQRKVYFDNLGSDAAPRIRAEMRREGERFLRRINRLLGRYDRDRNAKAPGGRRYTAGIGAYFFETWPRDEEPVPQPGGARRRIRGKKR